jgi:NADPH:quinone reductase-like Zn-dependent oxidoreductase
LFAGAYAQYAASAATGAIAPEPTSLDFLQAAALPIPALTACEAMTALEFASNEMLRSIGATGDRAAIGAHAPCDACAPRSRLLLTGRS